MHSMAQMRASSSLPDLLSLAEMVTLQAAALVLLSASAAAAPVLLSEIGILPACESMRVYVSGGTPPYTLTVYALDGPAQTSALVSTSKEAEWTWLNPDSEPDKRVWLALRDAAGAPRTAPAQFIVRGACDNAASLRVAAPGPRVAASHPEPLAFLARERISLRAWSKASPYSSLDGIARKAALGTSDASVTARAVPGEGTAGAGSIMKYAADSPGVALAGSLPLQQLVARADSPAPQSHTPIIIGAVLGGLLLLVMFSFCASYSVLARRRRHRGRGRNADSESTLVDSRNTPLCTKQPLRADKARSKRILDLDLASEFDDPSESAHEHDVIVLDISAKNRSLCDASSSRASTPPPLSIPPLQPYVPSSRPSSRPSSSSSSSRAFQAPSRIPPPAHTRAVSWHSPTPPVFVTPPSPHVASPSSPLRPLPVPPSSAPAQAGAVFAGSQAAALGAQRAGLDEQERERRIRAVRSAMDMGAARPSDRRARRHQTRSAPGDQPPPYVR